eukprot:1671967-Rhodomonas_salina.2
MHSLCRVRYWASVSAYAPAAWCPVVTYCISLRRVRVSPYAASGTNLAYGATRKLVEPALLSLSVTHKGEGGGEEEGDGGREVWRVEEDAAALEAGLVASRYAATRFLGRVRY